MAVTETTTESWSSRLGSAMKGVLIGLGLFVLGFPLLFWNEGNTVKTRKALEEGEGACVAVESNAKVDPANEGKLVHMTGRADTKDVLSDEAFGVSANAIRLERKVEMYQWKEEKHVRKEKNAGGSETTTTTYTYKMAWSSSAIDSSGFKEAGHDNPAMEWTGERKQSENVAFGAFRLNQGQISSIGESQSYVIPTNLVCPVARVTLRGNTIYVANAETRGNPNDTRDVVSTPRLGDVRVTYSYVMPHDVSVVSQQKGDTFVAYTAKNGKKVQLLADGVKTAAEMFADAQTSNTMMCWAIRLAGFLMMFFGLQMTFKPLSVLGDVLPVLGNVVEMGTSVVSFLIALPCALVTIAIAWLFYRPVLGVALLAAAGFFVYLLIKRKRKSAASAASAEAPSPQETSATA